MVLWCGVGYLRGPGECQAIRGPKNVAGDHVFFFWSQLRREESSLGPRPDRFPPVNCTNTLHLVTKSISLPSLIASEHAWGREHDE